MFGWEGWSLSAPRPGRRIRPATPDEYAAMPADDKRTEIVEDAEPEAFFSDPQSARAKEFLAKILTH